MKNIVILLVVFFGVTQAARAQDAVYRNDTLIYKGIKIYPSKQIQILYGSRENKFFAYVYLKSHNYPAPSTLSKQRGVVSSIIKKDGKYYALGKFNNAP